MTGEDQGDSEHSMTVSDNAEPSTDEREPVQAAASLQPSGDAFANQPQSAAASPPAGDGLSQPACPWPGHAGLRDRHVPQQALFSQQLWEVQLLIDYLSGNPTRRLPDEASATAAGLPKNWIEQVCQMTWPASGSALSQADQEALLIKVKDYLNAMATPASGFSIAFTLLVTQEDEPVPTRLRRKRREQDMIDEEPRQSSMTESRGSLARKAYPDLMLKSRSFRRGIRWIAIALTLWLALTCLLSWNLALGNSDLGQLALARGALTDAQAKMVSAQNAQATAPGFPGGAAGSTTAEPSPVPGGINPSANTAIKPGVAYCDQPKLFPPATIGNISSPIYVSATQADLCASLASAKAELTAAKARVSAWLWRFRGNLDEDQSVLSATAIVNMLGSAVLPVFYGILGAAAAVLRLLSRRMRLSLLTPRDLSLSLQQLALGAVIGACIGLFVSSPSTPGSGSGGLLGPVNLSGSALSFVAGFGVDAVFSALEALIARLFNTSPVPTQSK